MMDETRVTGCTLVYLLFTAIGCCEPIDRKEGHC